MCYFDWILPKLPKLPGPQFAICFGTGHAHFQAINIDTSLNGLSFSAGEAKPTATLMASEHLRRRTFCRVWVIGGQRHDIRDCQHPASNPCQFDALHPDLAAILAFA